MALFQKHDWGNNDLKHCERIFGISLVTGFVCVCVPLVCISFSTNFMQTKEESQTDILDLHMFFSSGLLVRNIFLRRRFLSEGSAAASSSHLRRDWSKYWILSDFALISHLHEHAHGCYLIYICIYTHIYIYIIYIYIYA